MCSARALDVDFSLDADRLSVKCPVKVAYTVTEPKVIKRLVECRAAGDAKYKSKPSVVTVYYPEKDVSLFEVAKKFHTTVAKIARDNAIGEQTVALGAQNNPPEVKKLIIR